jgi:hypothetical protein
MNTQNAYEKLGVNENATFEEIQNAKQRLGEQYQNDSQLLESVEAAYDEIIMDRLKKRQEGKIKVPDRIRFPEAQKQPAEPRFKLNPAPRENAPNWLQNLIDTPSQGDILLPAGIFAGLGLLSLVIAGTGDTSIVPLLLAGGGFTCAYFLNRKEQRFGRAVLLTVIGLIVGVSLGSVLASTLESQISVLSGEQITTFVTMFFFWAISSFLR